MSNYNFNDLQWLTTLQYGINKEKWDMLIEEFDRIRTLVLEIKSGQERVPLASYADTAGSAGSATNATTAAECSGNATTATWAENAGHARSADSATSATSTTPHPPG
jgi:hypothetical protein